MKKNPIRNLIAASLVTVFASSANADDGIVSGQEYVDHFPALSDTLQHNYNVNLANLEFKEVGRFPAMCADMDQDGKADTRHVSVTDTDYIRDNSVIYGGYLISPNGQIEQYNVPTSANDPVEIIEGLNAEVKHQLFRMLDSSEGLSITSHDSKGRLTGVMISDGLQIMAATTIKRDGYNLVACPTTKPKPGL